MDNGVNCPRGKAVGARNFTSPFNVEVANALFNDAVTRKDYTASMAEEWKCVQSTGTLPFSQ